MRPLADWVQTLGISIQPLIALLAALCGLVLGAIALGMVSLARSNSVARGAAQRANEQRGQSEAAIESLRQTVDALARQLGEVQREMATMPAAPKPGFNLSRRSEVLRMHRHGQAAEQIASELGIPSQEVDLLLKVHRIVINAS